MTKPLFIPDKNKWKGLTVWCRECNTSIDKICRTTGKSIQSCPNGESHVFKVIQHIEGTRNTRRSTVLKTRDVNEAVKLAIEFSEKIIQETKETIKEKRIIRKEVEQDHTSPLLFLHAASEYVGWLRGENTPDHHKKHIKSIAHCKDVERGIEMFTACGQRNGQDMKSLTMDNLSDNLVGHFHKHLIKERGFSNRTYNKYIGHLTSFVNWYQKHHSITVPNYFENAERRETLSNPLGITKDQFIGLLKITTPNNGVKEYPNGEKRYLYRDYLIAAWRLGLETGRRREEIINMKFNDIIEDNYGKCIRTEDLKVNRIKNRTKEADKNYNYVPVTASLWELLQDLNYEKYKNTDTHLLAPAIKNNRLNSIAASISKAFSHYFDQLGTGKHLTFKSLRKTYISALSLYTPNVRAITGHSSTEVIDRFYIDREAISKAAINFSVFNREETRKDSLNTIRNKSNQKEAGKEID